EPSQSLREYYCQALSNRAAMLVQFRPQSADGTAKASEFLASFNLQLDKAAQARLRRTRFVQLLQELLQSRNAQLNDSVTNVVLRPKVIVSVSQRNSGFPCDVGKSRIAEAVPISEFHGGLSKSLAAIRFRFWHRVLSPLT